MKTEEKTIRDDNTKTIVIDTDITDNVNDGVTSVFDEIQKQLDVQNSRHNKIIATILRSIKNDFMKSISVIDKEIEGVGTKTSKLYMINQDPMLFGLAEIGYLRCQLKDATQKRDNLERECYSRKRMVARIDRFLCGFLLGIMVASMMAALFGNEPIATGSVVAIVVYMIGSIFILPAFRFKVKEILKEIKSLSEKIATLQDNVNEMTLTLNRRTKCIDAHIDRITIEIEKLKSIADTDVSDLSKLFEEGRIFDVRS